MRPIRFPTHPFECQLSATRLSESAEAGEVARDLGYSGRTHQPPRVREVGPSSVLYCWPADRPAPRNPTPR